MARRLEIRLLHYFALITLAAIMIGVEFYFEMNRPDLQAEICQVAAQGEPDGNDGLAHLRNKIVIMFGVLTLVVAIVLMMFIKNITTPLLKMVTVAKLINEGDLSQVIQVESNDEIGQVGNTINDLTSNIQEVAAFTSVSAGEALEQLAVLQERLASGDEVSPEELIEIRMSLASLKDFVDSFKLL